MVSEDLLKGLDALCPRLKLNIRTHLQLASHSHQLGQFRGCTRFWRRSWQCYLECSYSFRYRRRPSHRRCRRGKEGHVRQRRWTGMGWRT